MPGKQLLPVLLEMEGNNLNKLWIHILKSYFLFRKNKTKCANSKLILYGRKFLIV